MDFTQALDTRASDVEKPPVQPQGTYIWTVTKQPIQSTSQSGDWNIIEFPIVAVQAEDDVDPDELSEFGDLTAARNRISFMFPTDPDKEADVKRSLYRLKNFLLNTLMIDADEDASIKELLAASVGQQFLASATWRQVEDNTYVDVKNYAPID